MKTRTSPRSETSPKAGLILCALAVLALAALWAGSAQASVLTWNNGASNMQWDTASTNWGGTTLWNNTTPDSATFGATGVGTVSLTAPITVGALTFSTTGYTIQNDGTPANTLALKSAGDFSITVGTGVTAEMVSAIMTNSAVTSDTIKTGSGTLVLSGTTSGLTKQIRLQGGTIKVSNMAALGSGSFKTYSSGSSTLLYTGSGETTGKSVILDSDTSSYVFTLDQSGTGLLKFTAFSVQNRAGKSGHTLVLQGSNTGNGEISSAIANPGNNGQKVRKEGTNTWTLSGNNTYTGGTTINNGTLVADHNSALGTGTTTINGGTLEIAATRTITKAITLTSGTLVVNGAINTGALTLTAGTIKGSGTIGQAMTIGSGLTLSPGGSIGLLGTGNLTISGTLDNELGCSGITPVSDLVNVTGTVTLNSGANLKLTLGSGLSNPAIDDIFYLVSNDLADAVTGVFTKLNGTATTLDEGSQFTWNTQQWKITYTANASSGFTGGNDIALKVMPEPATLALLGLGGLGLILGRKRR